MYRKILNLAFATVGFAALASCSSDDGLNKKGGTSDDHSYLAITVKSVGVTPSTRAFSDADLEYGKEDENSIKSIRFYFFDAKGDPFILANSNGGTGNSIIKSSNDFYSTEEGKTPNIEKQVVVDIASGTNTALPVSVIAIVNPENVTIASLRDQMSVAQLRETSLQTGITYAEGVINANGYATSDNKDFVMTNSVYDNDGTSTCAALISGTNICTTQEDARQHPVDIYVERVAAKIRVKHATVAEGTEATADDWTTINGKPAIKVGSTEGMSGVTTAEEVYAVIDGWGVADEAPRAALEKNIGTSVDWNSWVTGAPKFLGFTPWTSPDYYRSFWEITPQANTVNPDDEDSYTPVNHNFNSYTKTLGSNDDNTGIAYTLPSTPKEARPATSEIHNYVQTGRTKVLVAAHLMKKVGDDWVAADISEYKGQKFISEDDVKKAILNENTNIWVETTTEAGEKERKQLSGEDLTYVTFDANNTGSTFKDYQVKAQLNSTTTTGVTFYASQTGTEQISKEEVNNRLGRTPVDIHHQGMTYYYTPIRHLGASDSNLGYFGVVRNHLYDVTINTIGGFGTPVYNPEKVIIPIIPSDQSSYLSARINVLAWRIVPSTVDLDTTK